MPGSRLSAARAGSASNSARSVGRSTPGRRSTFIKVSDKPMFSASRAGEMKINRCTVVELRCTVDDADHLDRQTRPLRIADEVVTVLAGFLRRQRHEVQLVADLQLAPLDEVTGRNELVLVGRVGCPTVHQAHAARDETTRRTSRRIVEFVAVWHR